MADTTIPKMNPVGMVIGGLVLLGLAFLVGFGLKKGQNVATK